MERLQITIHPTGSDDRELTVIDAMQQVIDLLRLHSEARRGVTRPEEAFVWTLERASTNSPFTVTARADPTQPGTDVTEYVREVTREWSRGIDDLTKRGVASWWMDADSLGIAAALFSRNKNGVGVTEIVGAGADNPVRIDREMSDAGIQTVSTVDVLAIDAAAGEGEAWGDVRGVMTQAGVHNRKPSLRLATVDYGAVWCRLTEELAERFGSNTTLADTWKGKALVVEGKLIYKAGGRLSRIIAVDIRETPNVPAIDLDSIRDTDFTGGLDPVEYLRQLHEGQLG